MDPRVELQGHVQAQRGAPRTEGRELAGLGTGSSRDATPSPSLSVSSGAPRHQRCGDGQIWQAGQERPDFGQGHPT